MERVSNSEIPDDLPGYVRTVEKTMFSEFKNEDFAIRSTTRTDELNFYFTPSHHFRQRLIDKDVLARLQDGENLLSFGSGKAYLERLIVEGFLVNPNQIVLSDKNIQDLPKGFEGHQIDMHKQWPNFRRKFTYAIFPECFTSLLAFDRGLPESNSQLNEATITLIKRCFDILEEYGEVRIDGHYLRDDELKIIRQKLLEEGINIEWNSWLIVAKKTK